MPSHNLTDDLCTEASRAPYDRLPEESSRAWAAFVCYRDMGGKRSASKVCRELDHDYAMACKWSRVHCWVARAAAWDAEVDRVRKAELIDAQRALVKTHADVALKMRQKALQVIADPKVRLNADSALKWIVAAVKIEQVSIGLPSERTKIDMGPEKSADAVYYDALPRDKLLALGREALATLEDDAEQKE